MKILQLCHRIPFPPNDGGNIAMMNLTKSMQSQGFEVKLLTLNTLRHFVDEKKLPVDILRSTKMESIIVDTSVRPLNAFLNLFSNESYNISRFYSKGFEKKLIDVLKKEKFDIIQLESLFMAPYVECIRKNSSSKIILRAHNVEHVIWERLYEAEKNFLKKAYLKLLAGRLKKYELSMLNKYDAIIPITNEDERTFRDFGCKLPMHVVPVSIDVNNFQLQIDESKELALFHLGSMDWMPNIEGVEWFLKNCWNKIHKEVPALKLFLAGRNFPKRLMEEKPDGVICEGEIADARMYMDGKQIMIVPLSSGGGMRVKIIEGMAFGKTIISTTIGAEGINYTDGINILIADTPTQFLTQIKKCIADKVFCFSVGKAARQLAEESYSNETIGGNLKMFYEKLMGR